MKRTYISEGKGKSGKGYVKKRYDLKQHALKKQYLWKIRSNEKRYRKRGKIRWAKLSLFSRFWEYRESFPMNF